MSSNTLTDETIVHRTTRGAIWAILSSVGGRAVGLISTLVLTRYLTPAAYGAVNIAAVITTSASMLTEFGLVFYIVAKPHASRQHVFHVSVFHIAIGALVFALIYMGRDPLTLRLGVPEAAPFLGGLLLAELFTRVSGPAQRVLFRDLRVGTIEGWRAVSEIIYVVVAIVLAVKGFGGYAIVYADIVQWGLFCAVLTYAAGWREWAMPCKLTWEHTREIWRFGLPLTGAQAAYIVSSRWDTLLVGRAFGAGTVGRFTLAKNLAEIPSTHIGEHIGDVLLPSLARMTPEQRRQRVVTANAILVLVVAPLAIGLGAVAHTLTAVLFDPRWQAMAPMLVVLSVLAIFKPVGRLTHSYLLAIDRPRMATLIEVSKVALLFAFVIPLAKLGALAVCVGVGLAFVAPALGGLLAMHHADGVSSRGLARGVLRPLIAGLPMTAAVLGVRWVMTGVGYAGSVMTLVLEIGVGAMVFIGSAFLVDPSTARELMRLGRSAARRGTPPASEAEISTSTPPDGMA